MDIFDWFGAIFFASAFGVTIGLAAAESIVLSREGTMKQGVSQSETDSATD